MALVTVCYTNCLLNASKAHSMLPNSIEVITAHTEKLLHTNTIASPEQSMSGG